MKLSIIKSSKLSMAALVAANVMTISPANADGLVDFDIGNTHVCIGLNTCLFKPAKSKTRDHRDNTRDHREQSVESRDNTVVVIKPKVRDHRDQIVVRDHRTDAGKKIVVDPNRGTFPAKKVVVRDHRS